MQEITGKITKLIDYAKERLELKERDAICLQNRLLEILEGVDGEVTEDVLDEIYGALSLSPHEVNEKFQTLLKTDAKSATDWFYGYCVSNNYVKRAQLDKNPRFDSRGLIITVNKAKPEFRDPKKAKAGNSVDGGFAKCVICRENEGFGARNKRTLRTVDLTLGGESWFWQYSPYGYFHEHGIAVNCEHIPMHVDETTFGKLMDFVDMFPHYFIGCNAPLPRIGGSVLAHDHYQGGGEILPMHKAKSAMKLTYPGYKSAEIEILDWKGTAVRVVSQNRKDIAELCDKIRSAWADYDNPALGIISKDGDGVHNAISPTVIKTKRGYEMSVILRSNVTSEQYPDGVFHAHPEYHEIKKESIGLIEAQGLFILPGRLEDELNAVEGFISENEQLPPEYARFKLVYDEVKALLAGDKKLTVHKAMQEELGSICNRILENTAVFKTVDETAEFLKGIGFEK